MTSPTATPYRLLRRPLDDRMVAGVCSGIGRYFGIDPTLVRVGFAVVAIATWGAALVAYPVMWLLMPEDSRPEPPAWRSPTDPTWDQPPTSEPAEPTPPPAG